MTQRPPRSRPRRPAPAANQPLQAAYTAADHRPRRSVRAGLRARPGRALLPAERQRVDLPHLLLAGPGDHHSLHQRGRQADRGAAGRPQQQDGKLQTKLAAIVTAQAAIYKDTDHISAPGKLKTCTKILVQGQQVRLAGVKQVQTGLSPPCRQAPPRHGPEAGRPVGRLHRPRRLLQELYYTQAQKIMSNDGVNNVAVPHGAATSPTATSSRRAP